MTDGRAPFQTEATVGSEQGLPRHIGTHAAIKQDKMWQDCKHGPARRTLNTPDDESVEPNPGIMGVACQAPVATTAGLMVKLEAKRQEKGEDKFDKCLAIVNELQVGGFIVEIDGDCAALPRRFGGLCHVSSPLT